MEIFLEGAKEKGCRDLLAGSFCLVVGENERGGSSAGKAAESKGFWLEGIPGAEGCWRDIFRGEASIDDGERFF